MVSSSHFRRDRHFLPFTLYKIPPPPLRQQQQKGGGSSGISPRRSLKKSVSGISKLALAQAVQQAESDTASSPRGRRESRSRGSIIFGSSGGGAMKGFEDSAAGSPSLLRKSWALIIGKGIQPLLARGTVGN